MKIKFITKLISAVCAAVMATSFTAISVGAIKVPEGNAYLKQSADKLNRSIENLRTILSSQVLMSIYRNLNDMDLVNHMMWSSNTILSWRTYMVTDQNLINRIQNDIDNELVVYLKAIAESPTNLNLVESNTKKMRDKIKEMDEVLKEHNNNNLEKKLEEKFNSNELVDSILLNNNVEDFEEKFNSNELFNSILLDNDNNNVGNNNPNNPNLLKESIIFFENKQ